MSLNVEHGLVAAAHVIATAGICALVLSVSAAASTKNTETVLHSFGVGGDGMNPQAPVMVAKGTLYGTTFWGGDDFAGTLYSFGLGTGQEDVLFSFLDTSTSALIEAKGMLYGTTGGDDSGGTVFSFDLNTKTQTYLYVFCRLAKCADGANPGGPLIRREGALYGTTAAGGDGVGDSQDCGGSGCGTVFSFDPLTGAEKVLYSFCGQQDCADGKQPGTGLIDVGGLLYGTAWMGGAPGCGGNGCGTVFSVDPATGAERTLHTFCGLDCADGASPFAGLVEVKGTLYGTTEAGGLAGCNAIGCGTVFSIDPVTGAERIVYEFRGGKDGGHPEAALISLNGKLYGTTVIGGGRGCGGHGCGTAFSIDPESGVENVLHAFQGGTDGSFPHAGLVDVNGTLYGTTYYGGGIGCGGQGCGTLFSLERKP